AWLWLAALFEPADGFAAWRLCGAADWLQLSRSVCGAGGVGLGSGGGGGGGRGGGGGGAGAFARALGARASPLGGAGGRAVGAQGAELTAHWSWAPALVTEGEVRDLAQRWFVALEELVGHAASPGAGGRSPSDLPLVGLTQAEIDRLERQYPQIEDVLPLSPL